MRTMRFIDKNKVNKVMWTLAAASLSLNLSACTTEGEDDEFEPEDLDPMGAADGKFEAWNSANNPAYVDSNFLYYAHQLPATGEASRTPWPGDYFATARDSLNHKWDGTNPSAGEKWAKAFGRPDTQEQISRNYGVKSATWKKKCETNADCASEKDGSICAVSFDGAEKRCIPTWWGICHGWAPAALAEVAPKDPVTRTAADGTTVTFYPGDIEGLMSLMYTQVPTKFLSSRCNKDEPATDANGRLIDGECRDMNPGSWHILVTNMLGLRKQSFVLDRTYDDEVWNQPMRSYKIKNAVDGKVPEITKAEAMAKLGLNMSLTPLLPTTTIKKDEERSGEYTAPTAGEYTIKLTGTGDADLHVKKGEPATLTTYDCRPYTGTSVEECKVTLAAGEKVYWMVSGYGAESNVQVGVAAPNSTAEYVYNTAAKKFYYVEMEFCYIVESHPGRTPHNPDNYTTCENAQYILEADEYGKIVGGEWVGASRTNHPDFAWWPTGKPASSQASGLIKYTEVKALLDESAGTTAPTGPEVRELLKDFTINTSGSWTSKYVAIDVAAGVKKLEVTMTGTGDADLYVRRGANPTIYTHNCKSVTSGTSNETCTVDVSASGGTYFIRARTRTPGTTVSITANLIR